MNWYTQALPMALLLDAKERGAFSLPDEAGSTDKGRDRNESRKLPKGRGRNMRRSAILMLAAVAALLVSSGATIAAATVPVTVPGKADPWLAGMPDGSTTSANDTAPAQSPTEVAGLDLTTGDVLTFDVSGSVSFTPADVPPSILLMAAASTTSATTTTTRYSTQRTGSRILTPLRIPW